MKNLILPSLVALLSVAAFTQAAHAKAEVIDVQLKERTAFITVTYEGGHNDDHQFQVKDPVCFEANPGSCNFMVIHKSSDPGEALLEKVIEYQLPKAAESGYRLNFRGDGGGNVTVTLP